MQELEQPRPRAYTAAFLVACSLILFQVSFSRLVGYKLFYHFVFLAISLSLLGLGAAGTYVAVSRQADDEGPSIHRWLAALSFSVPIAFLLIANPLGVTHRPPIRIKLLGADAILYLLWCAPPMIWLNFCGGVVLARLFSRYSHRMGSLYAADLLGAGVGSLLCIGIMKYGSPPAAFVSGGLLAIVALVPYQRRVPRGRQREAGLALAALAVAIAALIFLGPASLRNFENFRSLEPLPRPIKYEWNHLIRTDHFPGWYRLDGEAATRIASWSEDRQAMSPNATPAYAIAPERPVVGIIGVGGGRQLVDARRSDASRIVGIDINPTILRWVQHEDRELNGGLFHAPHVELRLGDGRSVVRSSDYAFDLLVMQATDTYAATAVGAYALSENFLYTKEAIQDYFRSLSERGVLTISRWLFNPPRENLRLFATTLAALEDLGLPEPRRHVAMIAPLPSYEDLGKRRVWGYLLVSKRPFSAETLARLEAEVRRRKWSVLYALGQRSDTPFDALARARDRGEFQRSYPYLVSTVTDARPYLFQFYDPLHRSTYQAPQDWATVNIYQWSAITLLATLIACLILSLLAIVGPLLWVKRRAAPGTAADPPAISLAHGVFFAGLGVGFMALEIPIIQILSLYLGHPTYGFSVVLVSLLVATGLGSLLVDRLRIRAARLCAGIAAGLALLTVGIFPLVHGTLDLPSPARFAAALGLVALLGLPMGMPMPLGIREIGRSDRRSVAWAWAINGAASVVGSCLIMIAMVFSGSHTALGVAALCYAVAALARAAWRRPEGAGSVATP